MTRGHRLTLVVFFAIPSFGFLNFKSYFLPLLFRWRQEERADFLKQFLQLGIVNEQDFLNLIETLFKIAARRIPHSHKGTDNINAHEHRRLALENVRRYQSPVLGEGIRRVLPVLPAL